MPPRPLASLNLNAFPRVLPGCWMMSWVDMLLADATQPPRLLPSVHNGEGYRLILSSLLRAPSSTSSLPGRLCQCA